MKECPVCKNNRFFVVSERVITCSMCGRQFKKIIVPSSDIQFTDYNEFMENLT